MIDTLVDLGQSFNAHLQSALTSISGLLQSVPATIDIPSDVKSLVSFYFPVSGVADLLIVKYTCYSALFAASAVRFAIGFIKH